MTRLPGDSRATHALLATKENACFFNVVMHGLVPHPPAENDLQVSYLPVYLAGALAGVVYALILECPAGARPGVVHSPEDVQQVHGQVADSEHNHHRHQHLGHFSPRVQQRLGVRLAIWMQTVATWKKSKPEVEATTISCCFNGN